LNLWIVTAEFGTETFNIQVAEANAIARFAIAIPEALALMVVVGLSLKVIYARLPGDPNDEDFWEQLESRQARKSEEGA
jgi:hypothetical protein